MIAYLAALLFGITIEEISREEAAKLILEREVTFRYSPKVVEIDRRRNRP